MRYLRIDVPAYSRFVHQMCLVFKLADTVEIA